jgi:hypothetical protein
MKNLMCERAAMRIFTGLDEPACGADVLVRRVAS